MKVKTMEILSADKRSIGRSYASEKVLRVKSGPSGGTGGGGGGGSRSHRRANSTASSRLAGAHHRKVDSSNSPTGDDAGGTSATCSSTASHGPEEQRSLLAKLRNFGATFRAKQTLSTMSFEIHEPRYPEARQDSPSPPLSHHYPSSTRCDTLGLTREEVNLFTSKSTSSTKKSQPKTPVEVRAQKERDFWNGIVLQRMNVYGRMHLRTGEALMNLGHSQLRCNENEAAGKSFLGAVKIYQRLYGDFNLCVARALDKLGLAASRTLENLDLALAALEDSLRIRVEILGAEHVDSIDTLNNIAGVRLNQKNFQLSAKAYHSVYRYRCILFGSDHPSVAITATTLAEIMDQHLDSKAQAKELYFIALSVYQGLGQDKCQEAKRIQQSLARLEGKDEEKVDNMEPISEESPKVSDDASVKTTTTTTSNSTSPVSNNTKKIVAKSKPTEKPKSVKMTATNNTSTTSKSKKITEKSKPPPKPVSVKKTGRKTSKSSVNEESKGYHERLEL